MRRLISALAGGASLVAAGAAAAQSLEASPRSDPAMGPLRPDQAHFRAIYKELVESNAELSDGSCTAAAAKMQAHLAEAGYPAADLHPFAAPDHPREGGLVAVLPIVPTLLAGATDGVFMGDVGIPTYGVGETFYDPDFGHIHGLNERIGVKTLYEGRDFLWDLVNAYGMQG